MNASLFTVAILATFCYAVAGTVTSHSYTTKEDASSRKTMFISTFQFGADQPRGMLYAEVGDQSLVVAKSSDGKTFQVSWSEEHKLAGAGTYVVRVYNEEGHSNLRKAKRDGQSEKDVAPVATLEIHHQGVYQGPWLSSETVAVVLALILMYFAYTKKSGILA